MDIFMKATRLALRFQTPKGNLDVESLWQLRNSTPRKGESISDRELLMNLEEDLIAKVGSSVSRRNAVKKSQQQELDALRLEIVTTILDTFEKEDQQKVEEAAAREKKEKIKNFIVERQDEDLMNELKKLSLNELKAML